MLPGTLTPDLIQRRHAMSVGKPSCQAAVVAADSKPVYYVPGFAELSLLPKWDDSVGDLWHASELRTATGLHLPSTRYLR